ncbi:uncharacterized protein LOC135165089 [Diachasmimorpha longicaudata]|uniref:uncharacterized protein LOC135165089 n=1 Tax=Diachasmimorpha longicaudata TaxID=58733 RepID=UPI0030B8CFDD
MIIEVYLYHLLLVETFQSQSRTSPYNFSKCDRTVSVKRTIFVMAKAQILALMLMVVITFLAALMPVEGLAPQNPPQCILCRNG